MIEKSNNKLFEIEDNELDRKSEDMLHVEQYIKSQPRSEHKSEEEDDDA